MQVNCTNAKPLPDEHPLRLTHVRCIALKSVVSVTRTCASSPPCQLRIPLTIAGKPVVTTPATPAAPVKAAPAKQPVNRPSPSPIPFDQWPRRILWLYKRRHEADTGIGDTLARILAAKGADVFKRAFRAITGKDCGCADRQKRLNALYPYPSSPQTQSP